MALLNTYDLVAFVLIRQDALNAELLAAFAAVCLDGLHIGDMLVTELGDQAVLVH